MQYTPEELFVGSVENVPNCTPYTGEQTIWPKFMLMIVLEGQQQFVIDGVPFRLEAGTGRSRMPLVFMLNVAQHSTLRFITNSGAPLRKVMIAAPRPWLRRLIETEDGVPARQLHDFLARHLAHFSFEPGQHILQLAEKIAHPPPLLEGELGSLYLRAQGLDIMWQSCLAMMAEEMESPQAPSFLSLRACERARDYILANLGKDLTIDLIAGEVGASPSTVQRRFKEHFGVTVFDFVREKRLEAARAALANERVPVGTAAYLAGYNHVSSFTTAFRKAYGLTPKQVRNSRQP